MKPEQIAEGRRLKAAANEALEMGEHVSVRDAQKAVDAWDRWLDGNMDALLDAAERAEAAERELSEAREGLQAGRDLMAVVHGDGGHYREQYGDRKASEDAIAIVGALRVAYADALAALTPFAHADLCKALGGNAEGDTSRIFARNLAVITLGDCRRARAIVVASETDRTSAVEGAHRAYLQAAADAAAIDS